MPSLPLRLDAAFLGLNFAERELWTDTGLRARNNGVLIVSMLGHGAGQSPVVDCDLACAFLIRNTRVRQRVKKGGHDIPDDVQRRRFGQRVSADAGALLAAVRQYWANSHSGIVSQSAAVHTDAYDHANDS